MSLEQQWPEGPGLTALNRAYMRTRQKVRLYSARRLGMPRHEGVAETCLRRARRGAAPPSAIIVVVYVYGVHAVKFLARQGDDHPSGLVSHLLVELEHIVVIRQRHGVFVPADLKRLCLG